LRPRRSDIGDEAYLSSDVKIEDEDDGLGSVAANGYLEDFCEQSLSRGAEEESVVI
jgi:hypothetical protein